MRISKTEWDDIIMRLNRLEREQFAHIGDPFARCMVRGWPLTADDADKLRSRIIELETSRD